MTVYGLAQADVMEWCKIYAGPKFHALLCDPPYHLTTPVVGWETYKRNNVQGHAAGLIRRDSVGFMGKKWDGGDIAYRPETWAALAEHLHPGAFGMAFASSRGWHRLACAIEDAGLIIHPSIFGWCYGSGFPKATRIDTQIDKAAGAERQVTGKNPNAWPNVDGSYKDQKGEKWQSGHEPFLTAPATDLARAWEGHRYGLQALKPALEPIIVFQKPYEGKPVECITKTGAGNLNIDGGRIGTNESWDGSDRDSGPSSVLSGGADGSLNNMRSPSNPQGRWPANFFVQHSPQCVYKGTKRMKGTALSGPNAGIKTTDGPFGNYNRVHHSGDLQARDHTDPDGKETVADWECVEECPVRRLGEQSGSRHSHTGGAFQGPGLFFHRNEHPQGFDDQGTAARFFFNVDWQLEQADPVFYCAKSSRRERDAGLNVRLDAGMRGFNTSPRAYDGQVHGEIRVRNSHPTVKPLALCKWLATLLLPPEEYAPRRILIPFAGSGSEMIGAALVGWEEVIGIEAEEEYMEIAKARLEHWTKQPKQLELIGVRDD